MSLRRICGALLVVASIIAIYPVIQGLQFSMKTGSSLSAALDVAVILRLLGGGVALLGGLLAAFGKPGGAWLAMLGGGLLVAFTLLLQMMSGDSQMVWQVGVYALPVFALAVMLVASKRA